MSTVAAGFYVDPIDTRILRHWDGEVWTVSVQARAGGQSMTHSAPHVGKSDPVPVVEPTGERPGPTPATATTTANASVEDAKGSTDGGLVLAMIWAVLAVIIGAVIIAGAQTEAYGGDAYTGMQNATVHVARAVGWLIISTGALGLIIARSRS